MLSSLGLGFAVLWLVCIAMLPQQLTAGFVWWWCHHTGCVCSVRVAGCRLCAPVEFSVEALSISRVKGWPGLFSDALNPHVVVRSRLSEAAGVLSPVRGSRRVREMRE